MDNLSITTCSFYLRKQNTRNAKGICSLNKDIEYIDNDDNIVKTTVKSIFQSFSTAHEVSEKDDVNQKTFSCRYLVGRDISTDSFQCFSFEIQSGYYGSASTIVDADTREEKYIMTPNDVAEKIFYMFVVIPKDNNKVKVNKGMLVFQNIGVYGIKTVTLKKLRSYFSERFGLTIRCLTVSPELFVKKILIKENLKKMIMIRNHKSNEATDDYYTGYGTESRIISNLCFNETAWQKIMSGINHFIKGKSNLFEFQSLEYNQLKLEVLIGESTRTINLHNIENLSIIESIPASIRDLNGYADISRLCEYIIEVINDYLKEMVLEIKS